MLSVFVCVYIDCVSIFFAVPTCMEDLYLISRWHYYFITINASKLLLLTGSQAQVSSFYGAATGDIFFDNFGCTGTELSLLDCTNDAAIITGSCSHSSEAGVRCNPARKDTN